LWTKFVFISAASGLGALTRRPIGDYRAVPETRQLLTTLMGEIEAVARAHNVSLDPDVVAKTLAFVDNVEARIKPSMQLDVEAGRRFELEAIVGAVRRKGRERSIPTPASDFVYAALLPCLPA
jgi:2-dehydropantoate 2-reductase